MQTEYEAKFLDVDTAALRTALERNGARLVHGERLMRRNVFDYPDKRLEKMGGWIRVRDEGDRITLSYKQLVDRTITGTKEISIDVSDFDAASALLVAIGLRKDAYQETKRERWLLGDAEITIDTWPWIPPFVEIEGEDEECVRTAAGILGLPWSRAMHGSVETAYQEYYDVTEAEVDGWPEITFTPVPDWLQQRRRPTPGHRPA